MCDCRRNEVQERNLDELMRRANVEPLQHLTFDTFDPSVPGVVDAFAAARSFVQDTRGWLVLYGPFGAGKTHIAAAIAHALIQRRTRVFFQVVPELLDHLRQSMSPTSTVHYDELFEAVKSAEVLILDDLGEENETKWVQEKLFLIFNHRYNHRLPTVITTNRPPEAIDPRIWSRMFDRTLAISVEVSASDYRARPLRDRRGFTPRAPGRPVNSA